MYLAIINDQFKLADSLPELAFYLFEISVDQYGQVWCNGKPDTISYDLKVWPSDVVIQDFIYNRLRRILPPNIKIYRLTSI